MKDKDDKMKIIKNFCWGCGFEHNEDYYECVWDKQP